jgi:asparagine synthase (glutamine-hydrolysing)
MCGIVGFASPVQEPALGESFLREACAVLRQRGPDGEGVWCSGAVGLGHRRLSIIDLRAGAQPMSYMDGRYWITHNGEIYNYRELRHDLAGRGHRFRTTSDTEVVLAAVAEWGAAAPTAFRGIFAFAVWDTKERRLFLARDHVGVKPLFYYYRQDGCLIFASELKALLRATCVARDVQPEALADYLALGYVLGSRTILRDVSRLPPGSSLLWEDGRIRVRRFWDPAPVPSDRAQRRRPEGEYVEEYSALLAQAVSRQMVSDVPVGAFLSGGIDSSTIVYHMRAHSPRKIGTFSMGFAEPSYSELDYARGVAAALGTEHHAEEVVAADVAATLPALVRQFDEPLGDTSIIPTYCLSRLARRHVKVVLTGDGADETLAGYDTYVADRFQRLYQRLPTALHHRLLLPMSRRIHISRRKVGLSYKIRKFVAHADRVPDEAHYGWRLLFDSADRAALLGNVAAGYEPFATYREYYDRVPTADPLDRALYVDRNTWLANDILPKVDRASMAAGLEARVPFLDVDLVEFTMRLPARLKMRGLRRKVVLKRAMAGRLPAFVLKRRKSGFNAPVSDWLRGRLRDMTDDLLTGSSALVDLRHPVVAALWGAHRSGVADHGFPLWALISLLLWEREVLRTPATRPDGVSPSAHSASSVPGAPFRLPAHPNHS